MPNRCVAAGCSNTPRASANWDEQVALFASPQDVQTRSKWIASIKLKRPAVSLSDTFFLCSKHFDDECILNKEEYINSWKFGLKPPR